MNMPENLMRDGHVYLTVIGLCLLPEAAALCMAAALRAHGHTREAMYVTLVANLITLCRQCLAAVRLLRSAQDGSGRGGLEYRGWPSGRPGAADLPAASGPASV